MKPQGFSRRERLGQPAQFKNVYLERKIKKGEVVWIYKKVNGLVYARLGLSVSNKTCPTLVVRNRVKRLIRTVFRLNKARFETGQDFVIVFKKSPERIKYSVLEKEILKLL